MERDAFNVETISAMKTVTVDWRIPEDMNDDEWVKMRHFFDSAGVDPTDKPFVFMADGTNTQIINRIMEAADSFRGVVRHVKIKG